MAAYTIETAIDSLQKLIQSGFYVTAGTIAILTYRKASKTLLQPIRTETFKEQIKSISNLLNFFIGKDEMELRDSFGIRETFNANAFYMLDSYGATAFGMGFNFDERPYNRTACPSGKFSAKAIRAADGPITRKFIVDTAVSFEPHSANSWDNYLHEPLFLSRIQVDSIKSFKILLGSPLLPSECVKLGENFLKTIDKNTNLIGKVMTDSAKRLPDLYPTKSNFDSVALDWIWNDYNQRFDPLEKYAKEIAQFLRNYYKPDNLYETS